MIATEKMVPSLPAADAWKDREHPVDFVGILEGFDPSALCEEYLEEFASRNGYVTGMWDDQDDSESFRKRYYMGEISAAADVRELRQKAEKYLEAAAGGDDELLKKAFDYARKQLIHSLGTKTAFYIVRTENPKEAEAAERIKQEEQRKFDTLISSLQSSVSSKSEKPFSGYKEEVQTNIAGKIEKVRKGICNDAGRTFSQKDFALLLDYPVYKYMAQESGTQKTADPVLLEKLVMIAHANPEWLFDDELSEWDAEYDEGFAEFNVFASYDEILRWIKDGKPMRIQ